MTPKIEEVEKPEVGRYYMVPTVFNQSWHTRVPIYGPLHEDTEHINFPHEHWHVDWRFADKRFFDLK